MGQRMVVLNSTYTGFGNNSGAVLHVSQVPPNPAVIAPGPALLFVVVKGVPSVGIQIMVGPGQIGPQPILPIGLTHHCQLSWAPTWFQILLLGLMQDVLILKTVSLTLCHYGAHNEH